MSNTPSLLPCPFCSGANVKIHVYKGEAPDAFVQCHDCSSSGPSGESTTGAIEAWNRRTAQPVVREPLTQEQVSEIADAAHREYDRLVSSGQCAPRWSAVFAYLLERAHGITQKGGQHGTDN